MQYFKDVYNTSNIFKIKPGEIGDWIKLRLEHDNSGASPSWLCEYIILKERNSKTSLRFPCNR